MGGPPRPALPRRRLRRAGVVLRVGSAVRNWQPGRPGHGALQLRRRPGPVGPRRLDARRQPAHLGVRDQLRRARRPDDRQGQPADAQADPPEWEEAAVNALCNSTSYRMLVGRNGARMKQGDTVLVWGATGGIGGYAMQYVLNGGGTPVGVVSSPDKADAAPRARRRGGHRPQGRGLPLLVRRHDPGRVGVAALRQAGPRAGRRRPRHRVRASRPPDDGGVDLHVQAGRHGGHVRGDVGLHGRVRQPPLLDEAEAADLQPLRQLRRGVRRQPARSTRAASSRCCQQSTR